MKKLIFSASLLLLAACSAGNPEVRGKAQPTVAPNYPVPPVPPKTAPPVLPVIKPLPSLGNYQEFEIGDFAFFNSETTAQQDKHNENKMSVFFQVLKGGHSVNNVKAEDLRLTENGTNVTGFKLSVADQEKFNQPVDIMLLVDVTRSMQPFIDQAKQVLTNFIRTTAAKYQIRMCIGAFGDHLVKVGTFERTDKACVKFYNTNPNDPRKNQVRELINELSKLRAARGSEDPGGRDYEENPMGALIEAAKAPWGADAQRFVIVVTDAGFLYSPEKQGAIGESAPTLKATNEAIKAAGLKVFAVTPSMPGYNSEFQNEPSIVQASSGQHYEFSRVVSKRIKLDTILQQILILVNTTYKASYVVENAGLNPSLPVDQRKVEVQPVNADLGQIARVSVQSSMPSGRPEYKDTFEVADAPINPQSMKVYVNDQELASTQFTVSGTSVRFGSAPAPGARLRFEFMYEAFEKNLRLAQMTLPAGLTSQNSAIILNGVRARAEDVIFEGQSNLSLSDAVTAPNDPYSVRTNQRLKVKAVLTK